MPEPQPQLPEWTWAKPRRVQLFSISKTQWSRLRQFIETAKALPHEWKTTLGWSLASAGASLALAALFDSQIEQLPARLISELVAGAVFMISGITLIVTSRDSTESLSSTLTHALNHMDDVEQSFEPTTEALDQVTSGSTTSMSSATSTISQPQEKPE